MTCCDCGAVHDGCAAHAGRDRRRCPNLADGDGRLCDVHARCARAVTTWRYGEGVLTAFCAEPADWEAFDRGDPHCDGGTVTVEVTPLCQRHATDAAADRTRVVQLRDAA